MKYKLLGSSGLRVSELCLGTMTFGEEWGWGASKFESKKMLDLFTSKGGNFIDTANRYTEGSSETYLGDFISSDREYYVIGTKYSLFTRRDDPNASGNHRKNMIQAVEASLKRLNTDYIDLYWIHAWDFTTSVEEVMRGLDDLISSGKIMYIGISDTPAWIVSQANTLADLRGWSQFVGLQIEYSLLQRTPERDLIPMAREFGIGITAWAPLAGGALTGKYLEKSDEEKRLAEDSWRLNERSTEIVKEVVKIAKEMDCTPVELAIRWTMQKDDLIVPIVGARNVKQLEGSLTANDIRISEDHMNRLDELSSIDLGFPHDFLQTSGVRDVLFGGNYGKIEHRQP